MATTNFTEAQAAFGFFGYFDLLSDSSKRSWQGAYSVWTGYLTGTDATMACDGGGANPYYVSVDGGSPTAPTVSGSVLTLFSGLSDTPHLVQIVSDPAYSPTFNWTFTSGTLFSVTGAVPACSYGADLGPSINVSLAASPCIDARSYDLHSNIFGSSNITPNEHVPSSGVTDYAAGGSTVIRAKCTDLWIYTYATEAWYAIDDGSRVQVTLATLPGYGWRKLATGLDGGTIHDYTIVGSEDPSLIATLGIMVGGTGATFYTPAPRKRAVIFGDSIVAGRVVPGVLSGGIDFYIATIANGAVGQGCGFAGQDATGLSSDLASILATITIPDVAFVAIGKNDGAGAPFQASYTTIITDLLAAGVEKVVCFTLRPYDAGDAAKNANIQAAVASFASANVIFVDGTGWTGVATFDGLHPTQAGYDTLGAYEAVSFAPYLETLEEPSTILPSYIETVVRKQRAGSTFDYSSAGWFDVQFANTGWFDKDFIATGNGLNAAFAVTEAADTVTSAATAAEVATAAISEANDTLSAATTAAEVAALAITEADDTLSATVSANVALNVDLAVTEAADLLASAATDALVASATLIEADDTVASAASVAGAVSAALTEANDTLSSGATAAEVASAAITEAGDTLSSGVIAAEVVDSAITEVDDTLSSASATGLIGSAALTEADDSVVSDVTSSPGAVAAITEGDDSVTSGVTSALLLDAAVVEANDTLTSASVAAEVVSATLTEADDAATSLVGGSLLADASLAEADDTVASDATGAPGISASLVEENDTVASALTTSIAATLAVTETNDSLAAEIRAALIADLAAVEASDELFATAAVQSLLDGAMTEADDVLSSTVSESPNGGGATPEEIWNYVLSNGLTAGETLAQALEHAQNCCG